jgi:hypothetical protein
MNPVKHMGHWLASRFHWDVITGRWETIFTPLVHAQRKDSRS